MPRQDPGEPYYRVDSHEAKTILDAEPDNTVVIDVRRDDRMGHWPRFGGHSHTHR